MARMCAICEKTYMNGISQRHRRGVAGKRWLKRANATKRTYQPNLQLKTFVINGEEKQMKVCAKCLKGVRKFGRSHEYSKIAVA